MDPAKYRKRKYPYGNAMKKAYDAKVNRNLSRPYKRPRLTGGANWALRERAVQYPGGNIGQEVKAVDIADAPLSLNSTGAVAPLNLVRAGASYFNRVGRKINMKSIRVTFYTVPIRAQTNVDYARVILFYDKQTNGALPLIGDLLQTTDQAGTNSLTNQSGINLNNRERFVILRDERIYLPSVTGGAAPFTVGDFYPQNCDVGKYDWFVKLKGLETQYRADSAPSVIGDISTGGLFLATLGDFAAGGEGWQLQVESRLRFWDP